MTLARLIFVWTLVSAIAVGVAAGADTPRVRRVLILHSFGRDFASFSAVSSGFRTELAQQFAVPIEFLEASLETALFVALHIARVQPAGPARNRGKQTP